VSYSVDVNVLLYASDQSNPRQTAAIQFLESRVLDPDLFYLAWTTVMGYLRIATHPRIFAQPLSPADALSNVEALLNLPRVRVVSEAEGFLQVYREVSGSFPVRGNLVPDAHLAALLRQHGVGRLYTADADFRKFAFLEVRDPFISKR
jgi:toxin-antitoxin system PIN domain toxin